MSVTQLDIIDGIGVVPTTQEIGLAIIDHLEWGDNEHLLILQEKINGYLRFVESGEIFDTYPDAKGRKILITLYCKYRPDERGTWFLNKVAEIVDEAGMTFEHEVDETYKDLP